MSNILDKAIVLSLNRNWQAIGFGPVRKAIKALCGDEHRAPSVMAMDIQFPQAEDGSWNLDASPICTPVTWEQWVELPVREFDLVVHTARKAIRVPTVIIAVNFTKMPMREPKFTRRAIYERDGGRCQYTDKVVPFDQGTLEHIEPLSLGGKDTWDNVVWSDAKLNFEKANRRPEQVGLRLLRKPRRPPALPACATIRRPRHRDWMHFIHV